MTRDDVPWGQVAFSRQLLTVKISDAERIVESALADANRWPRATEEAEQALDRAERFSADAARWRQDLASLPEAAWVPSPDCNSSGRAR
jgi:hypothetical protein